MFEPREETSRRRFQAASTGDEVDFDRWLVSMRDKGMTSIAIKNEIEKLDHRSRSVLHSSIESRHWNLVKKLVEVFHCDVNLPGRDGETPLHTVVRLDPIHCENMIGYFVSHHADISKGDHYGRTALHHAAMRNHFDHVRRLLELGAPIDILDRKSASPLHYAARFDAFECVRLLVEHRASINRQDAHGNTPLHCLARSRSENQRTAYLLVHQVRSSSLDIENEDHQSVLSVACEHGQTRLVEMLLAHRANVGCSMPMHMAIKGGHLDIVHQLLDYPSSLPSTKFSLHLACQYNRIDILRMLLKRSHLDLEVRDEQGYTPLLTAGAFNHLDCLTLLLNHSADITARDEQSRNVLHICVEQQCQATLDFCLEWMRDDDVFINVDQSGETILHAAARTSSSEHFHRTIRRMLLQLSRLLDHQRYLTFLLKKNVCGRTAVHEAARIGHLSFLQLVFQSSIEGVQQRLCEETDQDFQTSLHLAAAAGHQEIVRFLLRQGANVCSIDMNDSTPLHQAAGHNQYLCVETLLRHRASIDRYDGRFNTPLHRASHEGHSTIVRLLLSHHADVTRRNCDGYNSLELAALNNHQITVQEFLRDPTWMDSLRNAQRSTDELSTPLRKLIRSMPQEAKEVFNRCINEIGRSDDDSYQMIYNYEFLEDQLAMWRWKEGRTVSPLTTMSISTRLDALGRNHPLYLIITHHHYDLLKHPLINQLVRRKWLQFSRTFFWILFLFYGFFLASFTSTILRVHHPQYYYSLFNASISSVSCETISRNLLRHESFLLTKKNFYDTLIKWLLFLTIFIHVVKNLLLICIRVKMFFGLSNLLELIALTLSVIFSHDFYSWQMSIRFRCSFQWQCGAVGILIGWITLIIYVQFLSASGIYVVMLEVILRKFLRFLPILLIFILGFGLSFHMLLQNQHVYQHTFDALVRTTLMLTGEFNYEEHLYPVDDDENRYYYQIVFLLYILFCILMTILIMNLLIASAVGEIPPLLERAHVKYSIMRLKLIMDYEIFLSTWNCLFPALKRRVRRLIEINQMETVYPNQVYRQNSKYNSIKKFFPNQ